jgi:hypothetical protein
MNVAAIEKDLCSICCIVGNMNCIFVPTARAAALKLAHSARPKARDLLEIETRSLSLYRGLKIVSRKMLLFNETRIRKLDRCFANFVIVLV